MFESVRLHFYKEHLLLITQRHLAFFKMDQPQPLFAYFRSFQQQFYRKIVDFNGIRTRIVRVEGQHVLPFHLKR